MNDLAATFDAHVQAEFQDLDLEATMATMTDAPYVHHVPTITGGNGTAGVRDFYGHHFIGQWPDDTETRQISRTVGEGNRTFALVGDVGGWAEEVEWRRAEGIAALLADEEEDVGALLGVLDVAADGGLVGRLARLRLPVE